MLITLRSFSPRRRSTFLIKMEKRHHRSAALVKRERNSASSWRRMGPCHDIHGPLPRIRDDGQVARSNFRLTMPAALFPSTPIVPNLHGRFLPIIDSTTANTARDSSFLDPLAALTQFPLRFLRMHFSFLSALKATPRLHCGRELRCVIIQQ